MANTGYDHSGPIVNQRTVNLCVSIDPFQIGEYVNYEAEREIFDALHFEAQSLVMAGEEVLKEGPQLHDWSRFGDCIPDAIGDAEKFSETFGDKVDVVVAAKLVTHPAFKHKDPAFYARHVKIIHCQPQWGYKWENDQRTDLVDLSKKTEEFRIWENGSHTDAWAEVQELIKKWPALDIAEDWRTKKSA